MADGSDDLDARDGCTRSQPVQISPDGPLGEAAWSKQRLSRATQPDISSQIRRLRKETSAGGVPAAQRSTGASLRARLTAALERNKQLAGENARLRLQLAHALGDQRSSRNRTGNDPEE